MRSPVRGGVLLAASAVVLALAAPVAAAPAAAAAPGLSARSVAQIAALGQAKLARTPAQRKIDSRLLAESTQRRGQRVATGVPTVRTGVEVDKAGKVTVDVRGRTGTALAAAVKAAGGTVRTAQPARGTLRADLPLTAVETLAARPEVTRVGLAAQWKTARVDPNRGDRAPATTRNRIDKARIAAALKRAAVAKKAGPAADAAVTPLVGAVTSEGDATHAADKVRANRKLSGVGIKVGVLSDGVDSLAASQGTGDLPPQVQVIDGQEGFGDEGTAILQIVHDLAPKAELAFATAVNSEESFADNIRALRAAGADVIVDDVIYFDESPFQDGPVAQAVIDVTDDGALYFSSAGNEGNVDDGTAGNWEGQFVGSGQQIGKFLGEAHDFDPGSAVQPYDPMTGGFVPVVLQWADPLGHSGNDYDVYALDPDGNVIGFSNTIQDGDDNPFEAFLVGGDFRVVVVKFSGESRYLQVTGFGGQFLDQGDLTGFATPGATRGHSTVPAAVSVAAAPAAAPLPFEVAPGVPNPSGPFPGVFTKKQKSEVFTSDGPRRVFFTPDGTPIPGGEVRAKPDLTAADGVSTSVPFFEQFYGTSAAAPHAAAIAALALSGNPGIDPAEVRAAMVSSALDIEAPGRDRDTGAGIVMANRTLAVTGSTPQPYAVAGEPTVTPVTGDGDAFLEPGETGDLAVPVTNLGDTAAASVTAQVSTTAAGVTITPTTRSYGRLAAGATATRTFRITVAASYEPGAPLALRIRVGFVGALSPTVRTARIVPGEPSTDVTDVAYTGPAIPIPVDPEATEVITLSVPLPVTGVGRASKVTFSIDGTDCSTAEDSTTVGIQHTWDSDLIGTLIAPDGTRVELFAFVGQDANNFCQVVFDDSATRPIQTADPTEAPFTGQWQPDEALSTLVGSPADGGWSFELVDGFPPEDGGALRAVSLHLSGYEPGPTG